MDEFVSNAGQYIQTSPWLAVLAVFVGGIVTASNPCVLAMIPLIPYGKQKIAPELLLTRMWASSYSMTEDATRTVAKDLKGACVARKVLDSEADDLLVELIKSQGRWVDPA